jgi:hypothetical protein
MNIFCAFPCVTSSHDKESYTKFESYGLAVEVMNNITEMATELYAQ